MDKGDFDTWVRTLSQCSSLKRENWERSGYDTEIQGIVDFFAPRATAKEWAELVKASEKHASVFDALRLLAAKSLREGAHIEPAVSLWLADFISGDAVRPRKKAGKKALSYKRRNMTFAHWVDVLRREGFPKRGDVSACAVVAAALEIAAPNPSGSQWTETLVAQAIEGQETMWDRHLSADCRD